MDMVKIGKFLALLRKEQRMTQEQLGEKLGVTNKTVSRWETGTYLPPVEMLSELSALYGITINEILSGERLDEAAYRVMAEENIKQVLESSAFTLKDKIDYYKKKWRKEHRFFTILGLIAILALLIGGTVLDNGLQLVAIVAGFAFVIIRYNQMMTYVEDRAFDGTGKR